jgi:hypothetical protein
MTDVSSKVKAKAFVRASLLAALQDLWQWSDEPAHKLRGSGLHSLYHHCEATPCDPVVVLLPTAASPGVSVRGFWRAGPGSCIWKMPLQRTLYLVLCSVVTCFPQQCPFVSITSGFNTDSY